MAQDFKELIRISGMTHVRTSPYYPQSNGKLERWHGTLKHWQAAIFAARDQKLAAARERRAAVRRE